MTQFWAWWYLALIVLNVVFAVLAATRGEVLWYGSIALLSAVLLTAEMRQGK